MLYTFRDVTDVMRKIRDYLDTHPNGKTAEKANKIIQTYMDYPKEFLDMKVYVKGRPPMNEWSIGSDALFVVTKHVFNDVIELTENDWDALNAIKEKNMLAPLKFPIRTKTQKQFIDYIYDIYCTFDKIKAAQTKLNRKFRKKMTTETDYPFDPNVIEMGQL